MKVFLFFGLFTNLIFNTINAEEILSQDSVKISKKIITINQEAMRAPASTMDGENNEGNETLSEAMENLEEEPKLWFNP
jgi:hypothetical protein